MRKFLIVISLLVSTNLFAQKSHFTPSPNCVEAYNKMVSFRIGEARAAISAEIKTDPYNHLIILLQNYEDFFKLCFKDDPDLYKRRLAFREKRLNFLNNSDKKSPYYRLSKAIIYLQWSLIHLKYKENFKAANDFRKAHGLLRDNKKLFPNFAETDIFYGGQKAIIGTVPQEYQWITNLMGFKGNIGQGMKMVKRGIDSNPPLFKDEGIFYYIYLNEILLNDSKKAFRLLQTYNVDDKNIYLNTFMTSNLMLNNFRSAEALSIIQNRNKSSAYIQPIIFDYALGVAYLQTSEFEKAIPYLKKYLTSKSYFYKKDATLKIAYAYYLMGEQNLSDSYKEKIKRTGTTITDMDKQAQKVAKQPSFGNKNLLRGRLLFDGGSFTECLAILEDETLKNNLGETENLEWDYRLARAYDETNKTAQAIAFYKKTLSADNPTEEYYPARAALQLAYIYEQQGKTALATTYFNRVLGIEGHEYKTSLDQKAKSGLLRIQGQ